MPLMPPWQFLNPADVMAWLDHQSPFVLKRIRFHAQWLLEQYGVDPDAEDEDKDEMGESGVASGEAEGAPEDFNSETGAAEASEGAPQPLMPPPKKSRHPGFGWNPGGGSSSGPFGWNPGRPQTGPFGWNPGGGSGSGPMQWTPSGWVAKDNSHKVTTTASRPLPEPEIIPPATANSSAFPEAAADRDKLAVLKNNVSMMQFELNKICKRFKIAKLNRDDLSEYPEDQQQRLKTAVNCVAAAEKTLADFKDFLREDKYKEWNEAQKKAREEKIKSMIGETPSGVPHKRKAENAEDQGGSQESNKSNDES